MSKKNEPVTVNADATVHTMSTCLVSIGQLYVNKKRTHIFVFPFSITVKPYENLKI